MAAACGAAAAQARVDSSSGPQAQASDRPASRFYGTARPQAPGTAPPPVHVAPPPSFSPPPSFAPPPAVVRPGGSVYVPPPVVRPPAYRPPYYHRPGVGVDVIIGTPYPRPYPYYPGTWGYPAYPPPPVIVGPPIVVSPPPPLVYVERPRDEEPPAAGYWYWCASPQGWYPEVNDCPQGWQPVPPRAAQ